MTDLILKLGQSNNGAGFFESGSLSLTNQYWYIDGNGIITNGRNSSGNQTPATVIALDSRYNFQMSGGGGVRYGWDGKCNDRLVALGASSSQGSRLFFAHWRGGTNSAEWVTNLATSPDTDTASAIIQVFRLKLRNALSMTGVRMGMVIIYQGESNAIGTAGAGPVEWPVHWGSICDNMITVVSNAGISWLHANLKFGIVQLPPTNPDPLTYINWNAMRTAQANFVSSRSDCVLIPAPDGPYNSGVGESVHLDWEGQSALGEAIGTVGYNDFGLR